MCGGIRGEIMKVMSGLGCKLNFLRKPNGCFLNIADVTGGGIGMGR